MFKLSDKMLVDRIFTKKPDEIITRFFE